VMTNDKEAGWAKITFRQTVDELIQNGPTIEIGVTCIDSGNGARVLAQIDTGAAGTGVSAKLAERLGLMPYGEHGEIHEAGRERLVVPYHFVRLTLPHADIEHEVACLPSLGAPHDVLIGRDILANSRLVVDFIAGVVGLHIRAS
jgi:predicted aspartyl protease